MTMDAQLGDFLSRPVKIADYLWGVTTDSDEVYDVWSLWQSNTAIKNKLRNYSFLRCKLKLRFMVNGTPFHYGLLCGAYVPYSGQLSLFRNLWDSVRVTNGVNRELVMSYLSTCPSAYLTPVDNSVVEMDIPFVWHNNWIDITQNPKESLGSLYLMDFAPLERANDDAAGAINVTVYAWAEDVELCTPTYFEPTSDEYDDSGVVSKTASAVAAGAGKLSDVPVIGPYARATEIGAGAVSSIAKIFGFSNPSQIADTEYYKQQPFRSLATTQTADTALKLTYDPKQELTVDPSVTGSGNQDEMTMDSICDRYMYLVSARWYPGQSGGGGSVGQSGTNRDLLFRSNVTPMIYKLGDSNYTVDPNTFQVVQPHPASMVGRLFDFYRCSITYRIQVIASKFASGRIKVSFDPRSNSDIQDTVVQMSEIIDLSVSREIEMTIDYVSNRPYLRTGDITKNFWPMNGSDGFDTSVTPLDRDYHIGSLTVVQVNELVSPNARPAYVVVHAKVNKGAEFNMPSEIFRNDLFLPTSEEVVPIQADAETKVSLIDAVQEPNRSKVFFGERIVSLRSLLKRSTLGLVTKSNDSDQVNNKYVTTTHEQTPRFRRWSNQTNWKMTYEAYLSNAYLLKRGGSRWRYVHRISEPDPNATTRLYAPLNNFYWAARKWKSSPPTYGVTETEIGTGDLVDAMETGLTGAIVTYAANNAGLEAEYPYYNPTRFSINQYADYSNNNYSENGTMYCQMSFTGGWITKRLTAFYYSTAEDYMLHFFLAAPPLYVLQ